MEYMMDDIKRVNRELKYKGVVVDFYSDTMVFPNGHTAQWDYIEHKGAAAVVPVTDEGKILMVRQYRNALERYTLEIPETLYTFLQEKNHPALSMDPLM